MLIKYDTEFCRQRDRVRDPGRACRGAYMITRDWLQHIIRYWCELFSKTLAERGHCAFYEKEENSTDYDSISILG